MGALLSRGTLGRWIKICSDEYFVPIYEYFHRLLLGREFAMADETRVQVLKEPNRNPETDSFMWLFRSGEDGLPPLILYRYTETRAKFNAAEFLKGFKGYLMTDGYQGYNNLPDIVREACWAHIRRKFCDAIPAGKKDDLSDPAVQGVQYCDKLFAIERYCRDNKLTFEKRHEFRNKKAPKILEAFWNWLDKQHPTKGSRLEKAVTYARNQRPYAETYLQDGRCSFSNNPSENSIRPFTVGRKNWLFCDTPGGAHASAVVYTMVEMAKAHGMNVEKYLTFLLEKRPHAGMTDEELEKLTPWRHMTKPLKNACTVCSVQAFYFTKVWIPCLDEALTDRHPVIFCRKETKKEWWMYKWARCICLHAKNAGMKSKETLASASHFQEYIRRQ